MPHDPSCPAVTSADMHPCECNFISPEECEAAGGHVFEVRGKPPYRCTFCDFQHDKTDSGKLVRSNRN